MKVVNSSRVFVSSLGLLSFSSAVVEAFHSSPLDSRFHQRQNDSTATKLDAASLAISFEEDLTLTRQIIMDHQERSSTVSKEQFIQQMEELVVKPTEAETLPSVEAEIVVEEVDISVPYDAAARLAYASFEGERGISYDAFQIQYLAEAVALVKSKQPKKEGDLSPPVVASKAATTEITIPETKSGVDDTDKKSFIQPAVTWFWKLISRK